MNNETKEINPASAQFSITETLPRTSHCMNGFATVDNETLWSDILDIELASGQRLKGIRDRIIINVEGILIWIGHIEGKERSNDVFLTMQENDKIGEITIEDKAYLVKTKGVQGRNNCAEIAQSH